MMNTKTLPLDEHVSHVLLVLVELFDMPVGRIDGRHHVDANGSRPRIEAKTWIDVPRDLEVERNDRRVQARRQMKGSFVEVADLARRDASPFRAQIDGFAGLVQYPSRTLENSNPLGLPCLRHREEG